MFDVYGSVATHHHLHARHPLPQRRDLLIAQRNTALFERQRRSAWMAALWAILTRRPSALLDLSTVERQGTVTHRTYLGSRTVALNAIVGSEGRTTDFDSAFRPRQHHTRERWLGIAAAMELGVVLPPVELIQISNAYFVRDGHHRISVARALGQRDIDALVTAWQVRGALLWVTPAPAHHAAVQTAEGVS